MLLIRKAKIEDIEDLIVMGASMVAESNFDHVGYNHRYFGEYLWQMICSDNCCILIAVRGEETLGAILCSVSPAATCPSLIANEHAFYVRPERRSLIVAQQLLKSYVEWATEQGAVRINAGNSAGAPDEGYQKLLSRSGFSKAGSIMYMNK